MASPRASGLRDQAQVVPLTGRVQECNDPKDDWLIETAIEGNADVLVTGDSDLKEPAVIAALADAGVRVLTVSDFLDELEAEEEPG